VLQAQVEPHFLFNTFAGLRGLIREEPDRAIMLLDRLTDYLRASIPKMRDDGINDSSTIGAQIDGAHAYLDLMKVRMGERLSFEFEVDEALRKADFPPLIVISLVENAIKHGIEPQPQGGHIALFVQTVGDRLQLTVADNGIGFEASQRARTSTYRTRGGGLGLTNIRAQLKTMYGNTASLTLKNPPTGGFAATIELPFVMEDANV
jgi:sensor histidine kinase YesM